MERMKTSFIIITFNRDHLLKKCLASLLKQINHSDEIIVISNGPKIKLESILTNKIQFHRIANTTPAAARNYAIQFVRNDWVCFLDDDILLPAGYIDNAKKIIHTYKPDVFGGPDQLPPNSNRFETALSLAIKSPLTTAHTRLRHKTTKNICKGSESNLILCHLWIKKHWLDKVKFNPFLMRNEENVLLDNLIKKGASTIYIPNLWVYHHRKKDFLSLHKAVSVSGFFRARTFCKNPEYKKIIYFMPLIFLFYLAFLVIQSEINLYLIPILLYIILNIITSIKECINDKKIELIPYVGIIQFFIVISYAFGFLKGLAFSGFSFLRGRGLGLDGI